MNQALDDRVGPLAASAADRRDATVSIDRRRGGAVGAAERDRLAEQVDALHVPAGADTDLVAVDGGVDGRLDRAMITRNVQDAGVGGGRSQRHGEHDGSDAATPASAHEGPLSHAREPHAPQLLSLLLLPR
jgi:hypothetical protein